MTKGIIMISPDKSYIGIWYNMARSQRLIDSNGT